MWEITLTITTVGLLLLGIIQYKFYKQNRDDDKLNETIKILQDEHQYEREKLIRIEADIIYTKKSVDKIEHHIETIYTVINELKDFIMIKGK